MGAAAARGEPAQLQEENLRLREEVASLKHQLESLAPASGASADWRLQVSSPLTEHRPQSKRKRHTSESLPSEGPWLDPVESFCPCCRRPIDVQWTCAEHVGSRPAEVSSDRFAYVALLFGASAASAGYVLGALALGQSLRASGSQHQRVLMHTSDVPGSLLGILRRSGLWQLREVEYLHGCKMLGPMKIWHGIFTKLRLFSLVEYSKVLFLDLDALVLKNIDHLFQLCPPAGMLKGRWQPEHGADIDGRDFFPTKQWNEPHGGINAGVMLLEPDEAICARMEREVTDEWHPEHIHSYGPEQEYLSRFFADRWSHISLIYNFQLFRFDPAQMVRKLGSLSSDCREAPEGRPDLLSSAAESIYAVQWSSYPKPWDFVDLSPDERERAVRKMSMQLCVPNCRRSFCSTGLSRSVQPWRRCLSRATGRSSLGSARRKDAQCRCKRQMQLNEQKCFFMFVCGCCCC
ncbi:unnamed protein product [Polarella glacialis]|uniref:Hexosyltransferase n=1 Tax=Polarella glacialis TaxID=89957 RepID=A0A813JSF6_POLGL|nr:unnamed protein product [Polarella glacialis]